MLLSALAWRDSADNVGAIGDALLRVEGGFLAREALHQQTRRFVYQDAHFGKPHYLLRASFMFPRPR